VRSTKSGSQTVAVRKYATMSIARTKALRVLTAAHLLGRSVTD
jgi:hypothetical protein